MTYDAAGNLRRGLGELEIDAECLPEPAVSSCRQPGDDEQWKSKSLKRDNCILSMVDNATVMG